MISPLGLVLGWAAATATVSYLFFQWLAVARERVLETHSTLIVLEQALSAAKDAETGQRGYLITHKDSYLQPYRQGLEAASERFKALRNLKTNDADQLARITSVEASWAAKVQEMDSTIDISRKQSIDAARAAVATDRGKTLMDQIRAIVSDIEQNEQSIRAKRILEVTSLTWRLLAFNLLTTLTGFAVLMYLLAGARNTAAELQAEVQNRISAEELANERAEQALTVRVMNRELVHRTKNLISVVQAIVRHQGKGTPEVDRYAAGLSNRLVSLGGTLDILIREQWTTVKLEDLLQSQLAHFAEELSNRVVVSAGPPVHFKVSEAQMLGLALHELGTNSAKYGALSVKEGRIDFHWTEEPALEGTTITISWIESGGPPVTEPERFGFGSRITGSLCARAVGGTAVSHYHRTGLEWVLTFNRSSLSAEVEADEAA